MRLDDDTRRRLSRARDILEAEDASSIADVAKKSGVSPFHFIRLFEAAFGATPHQYRTTARLDRARRLLASGMPVTNVCMEVGFSSLGSFSTLFARRIGEPPARYQRRVRPLVQVPADVVRVYAPSCLSLMVAALSQIPRSVEPRPILGSAPCASS